MPDYINKYTDLTEIPKRKYQGYVWYSNEERPEILSGQEDIEIDYAGKNPFVVEAMLYSPDEEISLMVKHTGRYLIREYDLKRLPEQAVLSESKKYLPHRLGDVHKICFKQLWIPETDPNCEDMDVLNLKAIIFTGFENSKNS